MRKHDKTIMHDNTPYMHGNIGFTKCICLHVTLHFSKGKDNMKQACMHAYAC
ncbi:hypothetical protein HanIR_Chr12g0572221 [Helianthus annuus]|nr:hypothetical protein HanIR_Chr12g0572221 [Helianthus annuus]